jgi:hypothetical protein
MGTQRRLQKISTAISLMGLALGFSVLGLLIVAKEHDGGASITGGILGILLGVAFLIAAGLHWKSGDQIQSGFQVEEVPAAEIVSEMRQAAEAICSFLKALNDVRVSVGTMSEAGRRDADKRTYQPLALPFWPGHTAVSRSVN